MQTKINLKIGEYNYNVKENMFSMVRSQFEDIPTEEYIRLVYLDPNESERGESKSFVISSDKKHGSSLEDTTYVHFYRNIPGGERKFTRSMGNLG